MAPDPWKVRRWIVCLNGSIWHPRLTIEECWWLLAGRWNDHYADEEQPSEDFPVLDRSYQANIDADGPSMCSLIGWFRAQFDAVSVEEHEVSLSVEEVMALAADEQAFQAWRSTGRDVDDLEAEGCELGVPEDDPQSGVPQPGRLYDCGFVEGPLEDGSYLVTVGNSGYQDTVLEKVERYLWDAHARSEGHYSARGVK